ncbi:MAG: hypothetical protein AAF266_01415 [Planctomycetota bacterium]
MTTVASRLFVLAILLVGLLGCRDDLSARITALSEPTGARESSLPALVSLINAVEQERGLPRQLVLPQGPDADNAAAAIADCYSEQLHVRLTPVVAPLLRPDAANDLRAEFLAKHELLLSKTAAAMDLPRCQFDVGHEYGFFARMVYLDDVAMACRLRLVAALTAASEKRGPEALNDVLRSLRLAHELSRVRNIDARVQAATLRSESLAIAAALFRSGALGRHEAEQLYGKLRDQLSDWPSDRRMLVGERAVIIHAYEAIRADMLSRLVTLEERRQLDSLGRFEALQSAPPDEIDADQVRYLKAIDQLLDVAERPHHGRLDAIDEALSIVNTAPTSFAATLFIDDLPEALRRVAEDRASVEAWTITLAAAGNLLTPPFRENSATGEEFTVERGADEIIVALDEINAVRLPILDR